MSGMNRNSSLWPKAIIAYFAVVITGIVFFVGWAIRQNMDLVRKDYYAEELQFQQQFDRVQRTQQLNGQASIAYDRAEQRITIALPREHAGQVSTGMIHLYRPSDAKLDRNIRMDLGSDGTHRLDAMQLEAGLWKVRFYWKLDEKEFYFDDSVLIAGKES